MSKFYEDRCGKVAFERNLEINEEVNFLDKSGHLLSCGGVYVSRRPTLLPSQNHYDFLTLPSKNKALLTLKNLEILQNDGLSDSFQEEELMEKTATGTVKKLLREHMN